jgi:hypothetical protein
MCRSGAPFSGDINEPCHGQGVVPQRGAALAPRLPPAGTELPHEAEALADHQAGPGPVFGRPVPRRLAARQSAANVWPSPSSIANWLSTSSSATTSTDQAPQTVECHSTRRVLHKVKAHEIGFGLLEQSPGRRTADVEAPCASDVSQRIPGPHKR